MTTTKRITVQVLVFLLRVFFLIGGLMWGVVLGSAYLAISAISWVADKSKHQRKAKTKLISKISN